MGDEDKGKKKRPDVIYRASWPIWKHFAELFAGLLMDLHSASVKFSLGDDKSFIKLYAIITEIYEYTTEICRPEFKTRIDNLSKKCLPVYKRLLNQHIKRLPSELKPEERESLVALRHEIMIALIQGNMIFPRERSSGKDRSPADALCPQ